MNIKRLIPCFLLTGSLLLGSCENEQITDMERHGTELPDGKYPLTFTAVQTAPIATPQTRVSESEDGMSSHWDGGEVINVQIADGNLGTYTLDESGKPTAQIPCYWQNTQSATINAWYSNITGQNTDDKTVDLNNQQDELAYVLKAVTTADYNTSNLELKFHHQLAKVRVKLTGDKSKDVKSVYVNNYTSCTVKNGDVTGESTGYIPMRNIDDEYYEANVVPMETITADDFIRLNDDTKASINDITELKAGNVYTITLTVGRASLKPGSDGKFTINEGDDVLIKDYNGTAPIVVNGDATITIEDIQLNAKGTAMEINNRATVTLNVVGTNNSLTSTNGSGIGAHENCHITIKGNGTANSQLTVSSGEGRNVGIGFIMGLGQGTFNYGNIEISDVTLSVTASSGGNDGDGAAIGVTGSQQGWQSQVVVGNITITNSNVRASSKRGAACIGTSLWENDIQPLNMGVISIKNSTVTATNTEVGSWLPACIGMGTVLAGSVTIQMIEIVDSTLKLTTNASNKVGKGVVYGTATITDGIYVNENLKSYDGWNP